MAVVGLLVLPLNQSAYQAGPELELWSTRDLSPDVPTNRGSARP